MKLTHFVMSKYLSTYLQLYWLLLYKITDKKKSVDKIESDKVIWAGHKEAKGKKVDQTEQYVSVS